jgi:hypothetical protein
VSPLHPTHSHLSRFKHSRWMLFPLAADCPQSETIVLHFVHISSVLYNEHTLVCTHDGMSSFCVAPITENAEWCLSSDHGKVTEYLLAICSLYHSLYFSGVRKKVRECHSTPDGDQDTVRQRVPCRRVFLATRTVLKGVTSTCEGSMCVASRCTGEKAPTANPRRVRQSLSSNAG